jgi:hypothetical protein
MTLAFSTQLNGKPTYFVEKIISSLHYKLRLGNELNKYLQSEKYKYEAKNIFIDKIIDVVPKHHTIRRYEKNKWKQGNKIHPVIYNRTPQRFQFAPTLNCISIQQIKITYTAENWRQPWVIVDGILLTGPEIESLAINDGFDNVKDFFNYFNENFTGKIIHWTNLKY